ncbi:MAG TPA: hypothetical protein VF533_05970 [Solirubrobacteraceae bacterium]|jgi:5-methylcytosine-specific restriction endonuclease McrBC regulatory subunit McrC
MATATATVVERRSTPLDAGVWEVLGDSEEFWELEGRGLLEVRAHRAGGVSLRGRSWVGRATAAGITISFEEKIPGALAKLIEHASQSAFRVEDVHGASTELGDLAALLIHELITRSREYVSRGADFEYTSDLHASSLIGGRIDVPETIKLRAQGRRHQAAFWRPDITRSVELNQTVLAALRQVELLAPGLPLKQGDLVHARGVAQMIDEARTPDVLFGARTGWVRRAQALADRLDEPLRADLAALASVVLAHESFEHGPAIGGSPRAWFLNLETLFEEALRRVLKAAAKPMRVTRGTESRLIFDSSGLYDATPDVVVRQSEGTVHAIGDAKYKDWPSASDASMHSDVYQLLAHAKAWDAGVAFLAYPHSEFDALDLGTSVTGCRTFAFALDVADLDGSAAAALSEMGIGP